MSKSYLISGLPSTGKTTIGNELEKLEYEVISADERFGYDGDIETEKRVTPPAELSREWYKTHGWIWSTTDVTSVIRTERDKPLFICGGSRNEQRLYRFFDKIFILHAPDDIISKRLQARHDPHTSSDLFISRMLEYNQNTHRRAQRFGGIIIETTRPLNDCMETILNHVHAS